MSLETAIITADRLPVFVADAMRPKLRPNEDALAHAKRLLAAVSECLGTMAPHQVAEWAIIVTVDEVTAHGRAFLAASLRKSGMVREADEVEAATADLPFLFIMGATIAGMSLPAGWEGVAS